VLSRYYECAKENNLDIVVRITADCPLIEPSIVDQILETMMDCKFYQYISNTLNRTFPRGLDCEAFYFENLKQAFLEATAPADREHVTPFMHRSIRPDLLRNISNPINLSQHRWTVDTPEDFELIKRIIETLYPKNPHFDFRDVLQLLSAYPDWVKLNAHIEQKV
jgi:spore coat polysaccharide biosynthesis protein SpsF